MAKHSMERCRICENYLRGVEQCKFCSFEWAKDYPPCIDVPFDIFDLDDDIGWTHLQIMDRLKFKGIDCLTADIWADNNIMYIIGANANKSCVAEALHLHEEVIYDDSERGWMIINLFQEKYIRGMLEDE